MRLGRRGRSCLAGTAGREGRLSCAGGREATDYSTTVLPGHRGPRKGQPRFGILDLVGRIEITDPAVFLAQLPLGFGPATAFGCGLMLIRRAA